MEKIITIETIRRFAYVNDAVCVRPIRGVVVFFPGLNNRDMHAFDPEEGEIFGEQGILYVIPYNNPWSWMNKQAVGYTDEILDVLFDAYDLPENTPVVSMGRSMGGLASLVYTHYAKRTPVACVANCPVCDAVYHFTEREDLPRTMYSALYYVEGTLEDALKSISPYHLAEHMPRVRYHIFHCDADQSVNMQMHSDRFVEKMRSLSHQVTYDVVPERGHCKLTYRMKERSMRYAMDAILTGDWHE